MRAAYKRANKITARCARALHRLRCCTQAKRVCTSAKHVCAPLRLVRHYAAPCAEKLRTTSRTTRPLSAQARARAHQQLRLQARARPSSSIPSRLASHVAPMAAQPKIFGREIFSKGCELTCRYDACSRHYGGRLAILVKVPIDTLVYNEHANCPPFVATHIRSSTTMVTLQKTKKIALTHTIALLAQPKEAIFKQLGPR